MERIKYLHETNKNIIITGTPRSGKSTVAWELCKKLHYNLIQVDSIVEAAKSAYPAYIPDQTPDRAWDDGMITPFLMAYLKELNDDPPRKKGINYVIEGCDIDLHAFFKHFSGDDFIIIGLCYPGTQPDDIYAAIKKHDNILDWSYYLSDEELREYTTDLYARNKAYVRLFEQYGIPYYDVSHDREQVLRQLQHVIVSKAITPAT